MIIARFPNGDWTELGDGDAVDFVEVDDGEEDIEGALLDLHDQVTARVIASAQVHEHHINRVQLSDEKGEKV